MENDHVLTLRRVLKAPLASVWRCWSEPALLMQWYCPKPWRVSQARMDLRVGGEFFVRMEGPAGEVQPLPGVFLAVEPQSRLVFTDAFCAAWLPSARAFMVGEVLMREASAGETDYVAMARHWNGEDCKAHEKMGFHEGWGAATAQLEALAASL